MTRLDERWMLLESSRKFMPAPSEWTHYMRGWQTRKKKRTDNSHRRTSRISVRVQGAFSVYGRSVAVRSYGARFLGTVVVEMYKSVPVRIIFAAPAQTLFSRFPGETKHQYRLAVLLRDARFNERIAIGTNIQAQTSGVPPQRPCASDGTI